MGHVWLTTSGSEGTPKLVALAKDALRCSARAVNAHLDCDADDRWLNVLPLFHAGGLGILVRAALSGATVLGDHDADGMPRRWKPAGFVERATRERATLSALVPTQLRDLVDAGHAAPPSMRAIVIGGDALDPPLYHAARALGWPILPSYGATETASQIATASLGSLTAATPDDAIPPLAILPHASVEHDEDGVLRVRSDALFTGYGIADGARVAFVDPKRDGWWRTTDRGRVRDGAVQVDGRIDDAVNIGGELISVAGLERTLAALPAGHGNRAVFVVPDPRLGAAVHLALTDGRDEAPVRDGFNAAVVPLARIARVHLVDRIPRSPLGKLERGALRALAREDDEAPSVGDEPDLR